VPAARRIPDVKQPLAWLTRIVTNIALDRLKSARSRRESYVGPWLPEPIVGRQWTASAPVDPADRVALDEQINLALLTILDQRPPAARRAPTPADDARWSCPTPAHRSRSS
jgi:RNA polymerase sigma-70 factor (ECF subfamily)